MKLKSRLFLNRKGYLQIDFAFAIFIFFLFFYIIYIKYDTFYISEIDSFNENKVIYSARDICNSFIHTSGYPLNWDGNGTNLKMIGIKNFNNNELNGTKLSYYDLTNYFSILDSFGRDLDFIKISIDGITTNTNYLDFGNGYLSDNYYSSYNCYSNYNSELVRVNIEVLIS